ncbi:ATP-dependent DNA helicase DDX11 [Planococcus citri]|uniref:ATP-dependent DNA helicase DDX11 n=1 Tax=Planococcus citri TaxID=170843 RepID=UPI0031F8F6F6
MDLKYQNSILKPPPDFSFPFPPYSIQKEFMSTLYEVLEKGQCGIFESPTGTGKSLSIICGALRWLCDHDTRNKEDLKKSIELLEKELSKFDFDAGADWLTVQSNQAVVSRDKIELQVKLQCIEDNEKFIQKIKDDFEKERLLKDKKAPCITRKLTPSLSETSDNDDTDMLLEEVQNDDADKSESEDETENEYEPTKIYFCSRTHSQLSQFIGEIKKTPYKDNIRVVPLASRQTLCINPDVKKLRTISLINERCLELQKNKTSKATQTGSSKQVIKKKKCSHSCPFNNTTSVKQLSEQITIEVKDVEELVHLGQKNTACPYYAARAAVRLSQLVVVPYNTLLHKSTREASKIKLKDNIVIIDEAHNLLDAIGNMHSSSVTGNQLCLCHNQLTQYKNKYEKLFSASNLLYLNQLIYVIGQLISIIGGKGGCNPAEGSGKTIDTKIYTLVEFVHVVEIDNYNLYKLLNFCQKSKLTRKLQGFAEKYQNIVTPVVKQEIGLKAFLKNISTKNNQAPEVPAAPQTQVNAESNNPILIVLSFIESLTNHCEDGRIICSRQATVGKGSLKFLLLNPAAHFEDIVKEAKSVIVAGGTMQPISEFRDQLFKNAGAEPSRIVDFSCGHVIQPQNILPIIVCSGSTGKQLDFSYQARDTVIMKNEVGRILDNMCNVVPAGIVCFFPSYDYEQSIYQHLEKSGIIEKLSKKKKIFREPKKTSEVDNVLAEYAKVIQSDKENCNKKPNGCLLFSVIGGKLSEGLNFSDDLGRCVIVVGLPYPNIKSAELQEKMSFLDKTAGPGSGQMHYENLCMKAVNQSIGRAVRHKDDYATVLLLDHRYSRPHIQSALPKWMKPSLQTCEKFGPVFSAVTKFFKSKRENP